MQWRMFTLLMPRVWIPRRGQMSRAADVIARLGQIYHVVAMPFHSDMEEQRRLYDPVSSETTERCSAVVL